MVHKGGFIENFIKSKLKIWGKLKYPFDVIGIGCAQWIGLYGDALVICRGMLQEMLNFEQLNLCWNKIKNLKVHTWANGIGHMSRIQCQKIGDSSGTTCRQNNRLVDIVNLTMFRFD